MLKCYKSKKVADIISNYGISDIFHYIKNTKQFNKTFDIEVSFRGIKLNGNFISLEGGKSFNGILKAELINNELYLQL